MSAFTLEDLSKIAHRALLVMLIKQLRVTILRTNQQYEDVHVCDTHLRLLFDFLFETVKEAMSRVMVLQDLRRDEVINLPNGRLLYICVSGRLGVRIRDPRIRRQQFW